MSDAFGFLVHLLAAFLFGGLVVAIILITARREDAARPAADDADDVRYERGPFFVVAHGVWFIVLQRDAGNDWYCDRFALLSEAIACADRLAAGEGG